MWRTATTVVRAATASVLLSRPAGALVNAALTAAALLLGGPATPAGAQDQSSDASLSGITVDGNDAIVTSTRQYRYDVSGYTTQVTGHHDYARGRLCRHRSNAALAKTVRTQSNHCFMSIYPACRLELLTVRHQ